MKRPWSSKKTSGRRNVNLWIYCKTLITKVEPDAEVKQSMNEINAAQKKRVAAQELAEADKIKIVDAEAEAEKTARYGSVLPSNGGLRR